MKKAGIVVVTYNRLDCLKKNIQHLKNLRREKEVLYFIYIVDNASEDGTEKYMRALSETEPEISYIRLSDNIGGAGGFSVGIKTAYDEGADYILGMDDDAYVTSDCMYNLLDAYKELHTVSCLFANSNQDMEFQNRIKEVRSWMFVGFFIPREVIGRVGFPRNDFFIYHDDAEYAFRIRKAGFNIYKVGDAVIEHRVEGAKMLPEKGPRFLRLRFYDLPDWKLYYFIRNMVLKYNPAYYRYYVCLTRAFLCMLKIIILRPQQTKVAWLGLRHGLIRKKGKVLTP